MKKSIFQNKNTNRALNIWQILTKSIGIENREKSEQNPGFSEL